MSSTIISPSTREIIRKFAEKQGNTEWIQYDPVSASGILQANQKSFGSAFIPDYQFGKAKVVVSFGADFLGSWLSTVEYTKGYTAARSLQDGRKEMLRHYQFEAGMTLSGSNADVRFPIKPSEEGAVVLALYNEIAKARGGQVLSGAQPSVDIGELAKDLLENEKQSIVISGSNDVNIQLLINGINQLLGNYGQTIGLDRKLLTKQGIDMDTDRLLSDLKAGNVSALLVWNANPVFDHPKGNEFAEAIKKIGLSISFAERKDETSSVCQYILPETNYLETWNDQEPKTGVFIVWPSQPLHQFLMPVRSRKHY